MTDKEEGWVDCGEWQKEGNEESFITQLNDPSVQGRWKEGRGEGVRRHPGRRKQGRRGRKGRGCREQILSRKKHVVTVSGPSREQYKVDRASVETLMELLSW